MSDLDPSKTFYIWADENPDGTLDIESEVPTPGPFNETLSRIKDIIDDHGGTMYLIECKCIRKIKRGKISVTPIKNKGAIKSESLLQSREDTHG
jgi:hypothetical protein